MWMLTGGGIRSRRAGVSSCIGGSPAMSAPRRGHLVLVSGRCSVPMSPSTMRRRVFGAVVGVVELVTLIVGLVAIRVAAACRRWSACR